MTREDQRMRVLKETVVLRLAQTQGDRPRYGRGGDSDHPPEGPRQMRRVGEASREGGLGQRNPLASSRRAESRRVQTGNLAATQPDLRSEELTKAAPARQTGRFGHFGHPPAAGRLRPNHQEHLPDPVLEVPTSLRPGAEPHQDLPKQAAGGLRG